MDQIIDILQQGLAILRDMPTFLNGFIADYGMWVYGLLFAIIFAETGLVVLPFLPGDSLLFAVGMLSAGGAMNVWMISLTLIVAGVLGDAVNYHVGRWIGPRVFRGESGGTLLEKLLNRKHLDRAHEFFETYGGKAVIMARFVPIVRTFVPFVAGAGAMTYSKFFVYNVVGAVAWVGICVGAGYMFGDMAVVKKNFELVIVGIIVVSCIPMAVEFILAKRRAKARAAATVNPDGTIPGVAPVDPKST
jgi:membrane-associated protein